METIHSLLIFSQTLSPFKLSGHRYCLGFRRSNSKTPAGAPKTTRTSDPLIKGQLLCQLSYWRKSRVFSFNRSTPRVGTTYLPVAGSALDYALQIHQTYPLSTFEVVCLRVLRRFVRFPLFRMAERVGFEPTDGFPSAVFKTAVINRSTTFPCWHQAYCPMPFLTPASSFLTIHFPSIPVRSLK